jgi:hypothetical protein
MSAYTNHIQLDGSVPCVYDMGIVKYKSIDEWYRDYMSHADVEICPYCIGNIANNILDDL